MNTHAETAEGGSNPDAVSGGEAPDWKSGNKALKRQYETVQARLAAAVAAGDQAAEATARAALDQVGATFYTSNKGLAVSSARRFSAAGTNVDDYMAAAACGLWEAFTRWDPDMGATFGTFSRQFISGRIQRTVRQAEFSHLSQSEFNLRKQVRVAQTALLAKLERNPSASEIATATGIPLEKVQRTLSSSTASLDSPVGDGTATLMDVVVGSKAGEPANLEGLEEVLDELSNLELWIVMARSDMQGGDPQDLKDIAAVIGIGREPVRRAATRGSLVLAAAQYAKRHGANPSPEELARFTQRPVEHVLRYGRASMRDVQDRHGRVVAAMRGARTVEERARASARYDRFGEQFLDETEQLAREISGRHAGPDGMIGVDEAYWTVYRAFTTWDEQSTTSFTRWARHVAQEYHGKPGSKPAVDTEPVDKATTWRWIRNAARSAVNA